MSALAQGQYAYKITEAGLVLSNNDVNDATTDRHGLMKPLAGDGALFFNGSGKWEQVVSDTNALAVASAMVNLLRTADTNLVNVSPYTNALGAVISGTANFGQNSGQTAYEWICDGQQARFRQSGTAQQIRLYVGSTNGLTAFTVSAWREISANSWARVAVSDDLRASLTPNSVNTLTVTMPGIEAGDLPGGRFEYSSASVYTLFAHTGVSAVTNFATVNTATTTNAFNWRAQTATAGTVPIIEFRMRAPDIVFIGDSITAGHGASDTEHYTALESTYKWQPKNSFPYHAARLLGMTYQNLAIGGQSRTNVDARLDTVIALRPKWVFDGTGFNDVSGTAATTYTQKWNFALTRYATNGIRPIIGLIIGADSISDANDLVADTFNDNVRRLATNAFPTAVLMDFRPWINTNDGAWPRTNLHAFKNDFSDDTTHPNATGYRVMAQAFANLLTNPSQQERVRFSDRILVPSDDAILNSVISPAIAIERYPRTGWNHNPAAEGWSFYVDGNRELDMTATYIGPAADGGLDLGQSGSDRFRDVHVSRSYRGATGTNSAPLFSFDAAPNAGWWWHGGQSTVSASIAGGRVIDIFATSLSPSASGSISLGNASSSWENGYIDRILTGSGTAGVAAISPRGGGNNGIYFPTDSEIAFSTGSTERLKIDASGNVTIADNDAYNATTWNNSTELPTKDAIRDKIESLSAGNGYTLPFYTPNISTVLSGSTYYSGTDWTTVSTTFTNVSFTVPKTGTIKDVFVNISVSGTLATSENVTIYIDKNAGTTTTLTSSSQWNAARIKHHFSGLSTSVTAGDYLAIRILTPTWVTQPTNVRFVGYIYIE